MIKLTKIYEDGELSSVYVKAAAIEWLEAMEGPGGKMFTHITTTTLAEDVTETPEQIRILMYGRDSSGAIMDA